jgi:hypothetical protein
MSAASTMRPYPATYDVAYPESSDRVTALFRIIMALPALVLVILVTSAASNLSLATALMLIFRRRYPAPWFTWQIYVNQFSARATAYAMLLRDEYPSTTDQQQVMLNANLDESALNRFLPLVKWFLAIPHYLALVFLGIAVIFTSVIAWFAVLITGHYPRGLHNFAVGVNRWSWRVTVYVSVLSTDRYPPFSLK